MDGGTALYGKMFLPKGFHDAPASWPAVVVGHGINALSIGIEKFAARFADRGLVAMAIDYQSYGFSGSGSDDIRLLEPDATTDDRRGHREGPRGMLLKRTNLNNVHEVADFRAAVSFLQGEPGVDPERIGIWGSSNGGARGHRRGGASTRGSRPSSRRSRRRARRRGAPVGIAPPTSKDAILRVRRRAGRGGRRRLLVQEQDRSVVQHAQSATCRPGAVRSIRSPRRRPCCSCRRRKTN